jgi:hypothetical protein
MEGCYIWQVLNAENYHAIIAVSFTGSWFMSCRDGLIFADSTGLVLFLRSKGNLAKMRALMPSPMAKMPYVRAKTIVLENVVQYQQYSTRHGYVIHMFLHLQLQTNTWSLFPHTCSSLAHSLSLAPSSFVAQNTKQSPP